MKTTIIIGGSFVSKFEAQSNAVSLILPENVSSYAGRFNLTRGGVSMIGEYEYKINDPSKDNYYIYKDGHAAFLSASYSQKGLGIVVSGKAIDNMSFRSERGAALTNLMINFLPALTKQHTYNLAATLYPYATQPTGELAFQADVLYKIKKKSKLGGKYGMLISVNYSQANGLDTTRFHNYQSDQSFTKLAKDSTRQGYSTNWGGVGDTYFKDFNVEIEKKFSKKLKVKATYFNFVYNSKVINPGNPNKLNNYFKGTIYADIYVLEVLTKLNRSHSIRTELQYLKTKQDYGDWATAVIEYSYSPNWFIAITNQYNLGNELTEYRVHYPNITIGYIKGANRISIGYGKQRAGIFCVGGVCRVVPAANGISLSITSSF